MTRPGLSRAAVHRIACAVVATEMPRLRDPAPPAATRGDWPEAMPIGDEGLGLDSMEQLGALGALAEAFDLDDDTLGEGPPQTVGAWTDWILRAHAAGPGRIAVRTSGSTGSPRLCVHAVSDLLEEAAFFATRFADGRRVVALVPADHLYGLVWTALLPDALGVPVVVRTVGASLSLEAGDLVVAVPDQWRALSRMTRHWPGDVVGVSSAGPLDDAVAAMLLAAGLAGLVDIYGASETGGSRCAHCPRSIMPCCPAGSSRRPAHTTGGSSTATAGTTTCPTMSRVSASASFDRSAGATARSRSPDTMFGPGVSPACCGRWRVSRTSRCGCTAMAG
ncbi:AMP-binding protein [Sphingomonas aerolata]|uniref:AMP-binding protein n=1 Tax=Sphingomonas aerolata TaxID=185951 RepID=UPI002FE1A677